MELYLMRHGIAEDSAPGQPDSGRKLTTAGRERTAAVLKLGRRGGLKPSLILSSPYIRALQTASIAADELQYESVIVQSGSLVPNSSPEDAWQEIRAHSGEEAILITSHEPLLGMLIGFLLGSPGLPVEVKKASICRIDLPGVRGVSPRGTLQWLITPKISLDENFG